ncbi:hypothetical protein [Aurantimicrobium minutum]|uniref:hypothetical protein n=1 Tax=Aurantimicrobium minutum TaxID=708131 RepID=UPI000BBB2CEB|nr:hypothetical protein [Aurantimicrobium minutum]
MKKTLLALATLGGGISLAIVPAISLIGVTKLFTIQEQGFLSVAIMFATYVGQTATAALIEAKLATPGQTEGIRLPNLLIWACGAIVLLLFIWPTSIWLIACSLPFLFTAMEAGRASAVAARRDKRELYASLTIALTSLVSLLLAFSEISQTFGVLALGVFLATVIRNAGLGNNKIQSSKPILVWVVADVGLTGAVFPVINFVIISQLGPEAAVAFAAISTASGAIGIPLTYLRMRLLSQHSKFEVLISSFAVFLAVFAIFIANWCGLFELFFGESWTEAASVSAIFFACLWRATAILTTIPFAKFRREGKAQLVTLVRLFSSLVIFLLAISVLPFNNLALVFVALFAGELFQWLLFEYFGRKARTK